MSSDARELLENIVFDVVKWDNIGNLSAVRDAIRTASDAELMGFIDRI